jgi:NAD(P)-dependent dehydrogenase (short-subunit alcohol dehydrogenase family)
MRFVITGANRGLGLEFTRQLVERGDHVHATCRDLRAADALQALAHAHPELLRLHEVEVTDDTSVAALARDLGSTPIDVLINNAGAHPKDGHLGQLDLNAITQGFLINSVAPLRVTQALMPLLRAGQGHRIVHISSQMGSIADNRMGGAYGYRMSKAALNMANKSLSLELAQTDERFASIVLHPGWVQTDMGGEQAPLETETSIRSMLKVIDGLTPDANGKFLSWQGHELPW